MDVLHPTIRAMLASAPRGRLELSGIGRWSRSLRATTGAHALLLVLPAEMRAGWTVLYECDPDGSFDGKWLGALRPLGVDLDQTLTARRMVPGDDLLRPEAPEFAHVTGAAEPTIVVPMLVGDGQTGWAVAAGAEPRHQRRLEAAVSAVAGDITAALAHQLAREDMLRTLLRALPQAAFVVGADREIRLANSAAADHFGLADGGGTLGSIQESTGVALAPLVETAAVGGARVASEVEGPRGPLRISAAGLPDPEVHDVAGPVLVACDDLSERRRVARQQNEFLSTVGHELRTPLTSLRSSIELLATADGSGGDESRRLAEMALRNCERLDRLIAELLDTASQRMGQIHLEREDTILVGALAATVDDVTHTAARTGRALDARLDPQARAFVDAVRAVEIVEALVANALKFTPRGGRIGLDLRAGVEHPVAAARAILDGAGESPLGCELCVEDDGVGMDDTTRSRAFEPFYQDGDPLGDRPSGAGLGLAIVRALTEAHGGVVRLESAPGEGTRIVVWLPATSVAADLLVRLAHLEAEARRQQKQGHGVALELVSGGAEPAGERIGGLELPSGLRACLLRVSPEWTPPGPLCRRIGNDGEAIGTSLARMLAECTAAAG